MKAILEFNLPEEQDDFEVASKAYRYKISLEDFDNYLRARLKYEDISDEKIYECIENIRNKLHEILNENDASVL